MALYSEVGEETKEENKEEWVGEKREALTKVQVNLEENNDKIKKRKIELDAAKKKDGSIIKTVCPEEKSKAKEEECKAKKRPRPNPKKEMGDPKKYVGLRVAKFFDDPTEEDQDNQIIYFGTIDRFTTGKSLWHVTYDDNDEEEFDFNEIRSVILLYTKNNKDDEKHISG